jgi:hypothetical protein
MNDRIRELADKVADIMPTGVYNLRYESGKRGVEFTDDALEKFAELIVEECANVADENYIHRGSRTCGLAIRLHFGVGE